MLSLAINLQIDSSDAEGKILSKLSHINGKKTDQFKFAETF